MINLNKLKHSRIRNANAWADIPVSQFNDAPHTTKTLFASKTIDDYVQLGGKLVYADFEGGRIDWSKKDGEV